MRMFITCLRAHVDMEVIASLSHQVARSRFRSHNLVYLSLCFLAVQSLALLAHILTIKSLEH